MSKKALKMAAKQRGLASSTISKLIKLILEFIQLVTLLFPAAFQCSNMVLPSLCVLVMLMYRQFLSLIFTM